MGKWIFSKVLICPSSVNQFIQDIATAQHALCLSDKWLLAYLFLFAQKWTMRLVQSQGRNKYPTNEECVTNATPLGVGVVSTLPRGSAENQTKIRGYQPSGYLHTYYQYPIRRHLICTYVYLFCPSLTPSPEECKRYYVHPKLLCLHI